MAANMEYNNGGHYDVDVGDEDGAFHDPYRHSHNNYQHQYTQPQHQGAYQYYARPHYNHDEPEEDSSFLWQTAMRIWQVTGPYCHFIVGVVCVLVYHYHGPIYRWFTNSYHDGAMLRRDVTWTEWLHDCWWQLSDYTRAYSQMGMELLRTVWSFSFPGDAAGGVSYEFGLGPDDPLIPNEQQPLNNINNRRRMMRLDCSSMPELEEIIPGVNSVAASPATTPAGDAGENDRFDAVPNGDGNHENGKKRHRHYRRWDQEELEPAFLNEKDYPPGWLVYHPVLGVVEKKRADEYNASRQKQQESNSTEIGVQEEEEAPQPEQTKKQGMDIDREKDTRTGSLASVTASSPSREVRLQNCADTTTKRQTDLPVIHSIAASG